MEACKKKRERRPYFEQYLISIGCRCWGVGDCSWFGDKRWGRGHSVGAHKHMAITSIRGWRMENDCCLMCCTLDQV